MKYTFFIIAFLFLLRPVMPVAEYVANYDYISKELCVNKNKPKLHCNGKCHLMKELAKASEQEKPASEKKAGEHPVEILFLEPIAKLEIAGVEYAVYPRQSFFYNNLYTHTGYESVFHPPSLFPKV